MSLQAPARRLPFRCEYRKIGWKSLLTLYPGLSRRILVHPQQRRTALVGREKAADDTTTPPENPVLEEWNRKQAAEAASSAGPSRSSPAPGMPAPGDIAASSIFEDDRRLREQSRREADRNKDDESSTTGGRGGRDPVAVARVVNPDPGARERWERKKVIQMVRKGGRLSKAQFLKRTEREHLVKSHNMKTSVKKLGMLARQISGKTIDDAIVQMRFSKKKVAQDVLRQLEFARDEAVVMRGMGLGSASASSGTETGAVADRTPPTERESGTGLQRRMSKPLEIQLKDGKRHQVTDPSKIYIDQAWVGRGPYGKLPDFRARGRTFLLRTPWTSLSVVLKEEATRVREWQEREARRRKQITEKVWTHLPDRPIQIQRQWYSW